MPNDAPRFRWIDKTDRHNPANRILEMHLPNGDPPAPLTTATGPEALYRALQFFWMFLEHAGGFRALCGGELEEGEVKALEGLVVSATELQCPLSTNVRGWMFCVAMDGDTIVASARIYPMRSTTEDDWRMLGACVAALGAPSTPVTPVEDTPPEVPLVWRWKRAYTGTVAPGIPTPA